MPKKKLTFEESLREIEAAQNVKKNKINHQIYVNSLNETLSTPKAARSKVQGSVQIKERPKDQLGFQMVVPGVERTAPKREYSKLMFSVINVFCNNEFIIKYSLNPFRPFLHFGPFWVSACLSGILFLGVHPSVRHNDCPSLCPYVFFS